MYAQHFGLERAPFSIAPDPRYLFMSERHREALAHLLYGVSAGGGFVVLTGEIGAGKTTICRSFLEQTPQGCRVAYVFNPKLTVQELLASICAEFGVQPGTREGREPTLKDHVDALNRSLLSTHAEGGSSVLIIDEAQSLSPDVLEQLRLLTNLETNEHKLLQIVLIGQPELREMLAAPGMQQLSQRVIARYHLDALQAEETALYIRHRMTVAGLRSALPFETRALSRIHRLTRGVPRRINLLCDRALLGAYARSEGQVSVAAVNEAAREVLPEADSRHAARLRPSRAGVLTSLILAGILSAAAAALLLRAETPIPPNATRSTTGATEPEAPAAEPIAQQSVSVTSPNEPVPSGMAGAAPLKETAPEAFDLPTGFDSLVGTDEQVWKALAQAWSAPVGSGDPCAGLAASQLRCYRNRQATLALVRQLDRPGILTLRDARGRSAPVLLAGLGARDALLRIDGRLRTVTLVALADYWRGEFATLWQIPAGPGSDSDQSGGAPPARWLASRLAQADGRAFTNPQAPDADELRTRIHTFQLAQGLPSDGIAGPVTLMQLNRATGFDEPHLLVLPAAPAPAR